MNCEEVKIKVFLKTRYPVIHGKVIKFNLQKKIFGCCYLQH